MKKRSTKKIAALLFNENSKPANLNTRAQTRFAKLLAAHQRNEQKMRRAFNAWEKTNAALRRIEKQLNNASQLLTKETP